MCKSANCPRYCELICSTNMYRLIFKSRYLCLKNHGIELFAEVKYHLPITFSSIVESFWNLRRASQIVLTRCEGSVIDEVEFAGFECQIRFQMTFIGATNFRLWYGDFFIYYKSFTINWGIYTDFSWLYFHWHFICAFCRTVFSYKLHITHRLGKNTSLFMTNSPIPW